MMNGDLYQVGHWAQLQTMVEFIGAPVISGIAIGLTILIAQQQKNNHLTILISGYLMSLLIILPFLILSIYFSEKICRWLSLSNSYQLDLILSLIAGYLSMGITLLSNLFVGKKQQGKALLLLLFCGTPTLFTLLFCRLVNVSHATTWVLGSVILMDLPINAALIYLSIQLFKNDHLSWALFRLTCHQLIRFIPAGLSIGILSPFCALMGRSIIASQQTWEYAGMATAIWRLSDWILSAAVAILYFHYLPLLSFDSSKGKIKSSINQIVLAICIPSFLGLFLLLIFRNNIFYIFYGPTTNVNFETALLFWSGEAFRIVSAIFLMGLFVLHATKMIAIWDFFSQPLFILLLLLGMSASLNLTGLAYLLSYLFYAVACILGFLYMERNKAVS